MQKVTAQNLKKIHIVLDIKTFMIITELVGGNTDLDLFVQKINMKQLKILTLYYNNHILEEQFIQKKVDIPKLEHIDLSHIEFPDPDAEKNYEAKIKKEKEKKERAEAIASGDISFTIKDKKEQCTAIGFEPATEKFADCVLRLVELDVKTQQTNQIALAQSQGNQQIADQLKKQRSDQSSQYFLDLSQKLLNPQSTVSAPSTSTCTISGGVYKNISCW